MASKSVQRWTIQGSQSGGHVHGLARCTGSGWKADEYLQTCRPNGPSQTKHQRRDGGNGRHRAFGATRLRPRTVREFWAAKSRTMRTLRTDDDGFSTAEESWKFEGGNGDLVELELQFARRATPRTKLEAKVYSAVKPEFYRLYRIEAAVDVVRSADGGTDRVQKYIFKGSGPRFRTLFDGSEQLVSITSFPWFSRQAFLPAQAK